MKSRTHIAAFTLALMGVMGASNANAIAVNLSGNFTGTGYAVVSFTTTLAGVVDMTYTGGFDDPNVSLFDAGGAHLITNDDADGLASSTYSRITRNLAAGSYSMLISSCCEAYGHAYYDHLAIETSTDGFNTGSYLTGGDGTLAGMQLFLDNSAYSAEAGDAPFALTLTGDATNIIAQAGTISMVPESDAYLMMLAGLGLVGAMVRRRKY